MRLGWDEYLLSLVIAVCCAFLLQPNAQKVLADDNTKPAYLTPRDAYVIANDANEYGRVGTLWEPRRFMMNADIMVLPGMPPEKRYLLVGNGFDFENQTHWSDKTFTSRVGACFLRNLDLSGGRGAVSCLDDGFPLDMPPPVGSPLPLCQTHAFFSLGVTASNDARLWLSDDGAPMLIYFSSHPVSCRGMSVVDLRHWIPALQSAFPKAPLRYNSQPTRLVYEDQGEYEKNWSPMSSSSGHLYVYTRLSPPKIIRQRAPASPQLYEVAGAGTVDCIASLISDQLPADSNHHGTPFLRLRMCKRDHCPPKAPIVLFSLINRKQSPWFYDTRVFVVNAQPPFNQISLSVSITFGGISSDEFVWAHGLTWLDPRFENDMLIGYLDDQIFISIGISDRSNAFLVTTPDKLLATQMACQQ